MSDSSPRLSVLGGSFDYPDGTHLPVHTHGWAQLVYASAGTMRVTTAAGTWVVPPQRAVWVPAGIEHEIKMTGLVAMRTVYIEPAAIPDPPQSCRVVIVSPLLRELVLRVAGLRPSQPSSDATERLAGVLLDEIRVAEDAPLHLPMPKDGRVRAVTDTLLDNPADARTLDDWSRDAGASARTLARLFVAETGLTFAGWRQQLRLIRALELLGQGRNVTEVAFNLGYESPSAFIAMFRRSLGRTPSRYFERG
jgi:AraC-like DNA-binding protein